ncbi:MAG: hypothetical protein M1818_000313 [Claussenomyces sp. TS43310]|nr:MAG: hypothetical protein M1818_000313 [Claussenomyces sp. TS43310]
MNSSAHSPVQLLPTYYGFIESTYDALVLFEACLSGMIAHVPRRPHDREREHIIKSGNIFIYEENASGIKRWTDGISWSPSRILGNFLIYRQLEKPFGPGEKKKAIKKPKAPPGGVTKSNNQNNGRTKGGLFQSFTSPAVPNGAYGDPGKMNPDVERALIGSLVDSYDFLSDGLVKKTISVCVNNVTHHLVSYYTLSDAACRKFNVPSKDPKLASISPRPQLTTKQNFRGPVDEIDPLDRMVYGRHRYDMTNQSMMQHSVPYMAPPEQHPNYQHANRMYHGDYVSAGSTSFENPVTAYSAEPSFPTQFAPTPGIYPAPQQTDYGGAESYSHQRYSVSSAVSSDGSRVQMPGTGDRNRRSSATTFRGSQDSGIAMHTNEGQPQGHATYFSRSREPSLHSSAGGNVSTALSQRALPSLSQPNEFRQVTYERPVSATNHYSIETGKDAMWQLAGNTSIGHAHYQQQWA